MNCRVCGFSDYIASSDDMNDARETVTVLPFRSPSRHGKLMRLKDVSAWP